MVYMPMGVNVKIFRYQFKYKTVLKFTLVVVYKYNRYLVAAFWRESGCLTMRAVVRQRGVANLPTYQPERMVCAIPSRSRSGCLLQ